MRRENEEGESVGRFLTKTAVYIQARLVGECQDSCKIFQTWCTQFGSHIHCLAPFWKHRAAWLHSEMCRDEAADTAVPVLETSLDPCLPLSLSCIDVLHLDTGAGGMN